MHPDYANGATPTAPGVTGSFAETAAFAVPPTFATPAVPSTPAKPAYSPQPVVSIRGLSKSYGTSGRKLRSNDDQQLTQALRNVSFSVVNGEFLGIMGPSGSGKSTLLNCISTIDRPTSGTISVAGQELTALSAKQLSTFRRTSLGFVFQDANLLDTLTGFENIALALTIRHTPVREVKSRVRAIAEQLSITDVLTRYPYQMSGGQRQRVAAARATVTRPALILADEPTGALDSQSARQLLQCLELLNRLGSTILMVTHDATTASFCDRILVIRDGMLAAELVRNEPLPGGAHSEEGRLRFYREIVALTTQFNEGADHAV